MSMQQDIRSDPAVDDRSLAMAWQLVFGRLDGEELVAAMVRRAFPGKIGLVSSFGAEAALLLAIVADVDRQVPVIFLDTGKHFPETLAYRDRLVRYFAMTDVRSIKPDPADMVALDPAGDLWQRNPDLCCHLRKVQPLSEALSPFDAWMTGRKRHQTDARAGLPTIEFVNDQVKVNPLANWTRDRVITAFRQRGLPEHPLIEQGYPSIGCANCTRCADPATPRDGRWAGHVKTECGIHLSR